MKIIKCAGYEGYSCKNKINPIGSSRLKYCPSCRKIVFRMSVRKYRNSPKGKLYEKKYNSSPTAIIARREYGWRKQGIIGLTYEMWESDMQKGCMLKFLGTCSGKLGADHDHKTGRYRGPLCTYHNRALAQLGDSSQLLKKCAEVLEIIEIETRKTEAARVGLGFKLPESI